MSRTKKNRKEKGMRAFLLKSNPHSKFLIFSKLLKWTILIKIVKTINRTKKKIFGKTCEVYTDVYNI